ncbi:hypothetical protein C8R42DRAFT_180852 [Lentinula raphanica]|nr:hypothetical protein C8R42DRAFT_180852 [Lentinula raphanica]
MSTPAGKTLGSTQQSSLPENYGLLTIAWLPPLTPLHQLCLISTMLFLSSMPPVVSSDQDPFDTLFKFGLFSWKLVAIL